jgi:hypothetical protein
MEKIENPVEEKKGSEKKEFFRHLEPGSVDVSNSNVEVWLVKIPGILQSKIEGASNKETIGEIELGEKEINLNIFDKQTKESTSYSMQTTPNIPNLYILQNKKRDKLITVEGVVKQYFKIVPKFTDKYQDSVRSRVEKTRGKRVILTTDERVTNRILPGQAKALKKAAEAEALALRQQQQQQIPIERAEKMSDEDLRNVLYGLFYEKPRWTMEELYKKTQQPRQFLKDVVKEICQYNGKGEYKSTYELKSQLKSQQQLQREQRLQDEEFKPMDEDQ